MGRTYTAGLDLGQASDPSALVILERREDAGYDPASVQRFTSRPLRQHWSDGDNVRHHTTVRRHDGRVVDLADMPEAELLSYDVRHALRYPLGTAYPQIVNDVHALLNTPPLRDNVMLVIDATGVGRPVCDLFMQVHDKHYSTVRVVITSGADATYDQDSGYWHVPKRDLVSTVQVPLQNKQLRFPDPKKMPAIADLAHELSNFRVTISAAGNDSYGAWRERDHDDLVLALALALWHAERPGVRVRHIAF